MRPFLRRFHCRVAGVGPARALATPILLVAGVLSAACGDTTPAAGHSDNAGPTARPAGSGTTRIRLRVAGAEGRGEATATLRDTATARDFASLLPVTLRMHDLSGREKP